jgi:hypothetical protein
MKFNISFLLLVPLAYGYLAPAYAVEELSKPYTSLTEETCKNHGWQWHQREDGTTVCLRTLGVSSLSLEKEECAANGWQWYQREDGKTWCMVGGQVIEDKIEAAIKEGDIAYLETLLLKGLPPHFGFNRYYGAPMMAVALRYKQCGVAKLLLDYGDDVDYFLYERKRTLPGATPPCEDFATSIKNAKK